MTKIAFSGAHSCGKTTAILDVYSYLKGKGVKSLGILPEVARWCPFDLNKQTTFKSQLWILTNQIQQEYQLQQTYDTVLCDRTVYDILAYSQYSKEHDKMNSGEYYFLDNMTDLWAREFSYDTIFYLTPVPVEKDGLRDGDVNYQLEIDKKMREIYSKADLGDKKLYMVDGTRKNRLKKIIKYLEDS